MADEQADEALPQDRDAVDPELLALPEPPRGRRSAVLATMALTAVAAVALAFAIRHDVAYFFSPDEVVDLGEVSSLDPATLRPNTTVRVSGTAMTSRAVRFRRVLTGARHAVFPLAGQRTLYVQVPDRDEAIAQTEFAGRLVTFDQLGGRHRAVQERLRSEMSLPVSGESFLLVADQTPSGSAWALFLALLCAAIVLVDLWLVLAWFRPLAGSLPAARAAAT